jgi:hypothetical protein
MQEEVKEPMVLDETNSVDCAIEAKEAALDLSATKANTQGDAKDKLLEEEAKLVAKYGSMSIEDQAFAILTDLGMVQMSPNPNNPNYDYSQDDENCKT